MSVNEALQDVCRRRRGRPALRLSSEALDYENLLDRIEARAESIAGTGPVALLSLDTREPLAFMVDFFAARRLGRTAVIHAEGVPPLLRARREQSLLGFLQPFSSETVFYSSGTVGSGKAIPLSDEQLLIAALAFPPSATIESTDRVAIAVPLGQIFGFVRGVLNGLLVGAETIVYSPRRDAIGEGAALGATLALISASQARLAAEVPGRAALRGVLSGGGPMAEGVAQKIEAERGVPFRLGYGLTESSGLGARQSLDRPRCTGSTGLPAPGLTVTIDAGGSLAAPGQTGEILLSGPAVFRGYADPAEASPLDAARRLHSGDLGFLDSEGELHVRGRAVSSIAAHGRYLCAEELEAAVLEKPGIAEAAAIPLGDAFGLLLVAEDPSEAFLQQVREHVSRRFPAFARPRRLRLVETIPRSPSGKLDRLAAARCFQT